MSTRSLLLLFFVLLCAPWATAPAAAQTPSGSPTPAEAKAFVAKVNADLKLLSTRLYTAEWIKATYITDDTERNAAWRQEEMMSYLSRATKEAARFRGLKLDPDTARSLHLLRIVPTLPAPSDASKREELASVAAKIDGIYGKGKWCGKDGKGKCQDINDLSRVLAKSRKNSELLDAWVGWHSISKEMRPLYTRMVTLGNEGAREIGFDNLGVLWRSVYDMPPDAFAAETDRLWGQVQPLYEDLHCYVRSKLAQTYGKEVVDVNGAIPAHLLGNMWAQDWSNIYPLVEPHKGAANLDVTSALVRQKYDAEKMVKRAESFFTSLGLKPLPQSFWERSMFTKPRDREVMCHASAWDVTYEGDVRIKMCTQINEEDLQTVHHELGHIYYYMYYYNLPVLYQAGAHDGFHEAIGDAVALSLTPAYLHQAKILPAVPKNERASLNVLMQMALQKVAFLPFGKLIDQWRWDVFSGKVTPENYNAAWWALREKYQGVRAPVARTEEDFDPGAKYHIPGNTPYMRYFLAHILQFQFHKAMCDAAGHKGPLHECSVAGNKEVGKRLQAMLSMGASRPWPDAMEALTGTRQMDAGPLLTYFAPLHTWLKEQNKNRTCGWSQPQ